MANTIVLTNNAKPPVVHGGLGTKTPIVVIPGPSGSDVNSSDFTKTQTSASASWTFAHSFDRIPSVDVYLSNGEQVDADVLATTTHVYVTFADPTTGFVILR